MAMRAIRNFVVATALAIVLSPTFTAILLAAPTLKGDGP
jgi:hypothetical protein